MRSRMYCSAVSGLQDVRAVLVDVRDAWDLPSAPESALGLTKALQDCAVPVVVALPDNGTDLAVSRSLRLRCAVVGSFASLARGIARAPRTQLSLS